MKTTRIEINVARPRAIGTTRKRSMAHYFRVTMYEGARMTEASALAEVFAAAYLDADIRIIETTTESRVV